ncbi:TfoX/Sxy family protein [Hydrogenophaga aromaticivorans]|uniref:TfoX/Sxy family protein n=1 Tax=Hydrogenophaga aromaticivorans TaxID=2610898 RepID=UPI000CC82A10|nr:TfoX/Sxy family protein [Hydrogenophaga aromaticivorans]MBU4183734.1 TfoX/Sxy family protein [Gammaproteobacteria bacterium]PKO77441.1 MAG: competence protein TfoX [Betaproteobacteria bacterium HGW-Betaproteobacteria-15]MBQ0918939.1 TfoX/Sxy family protein [Hydrogenophaga aromaticivorans]MBU4281244.1 TfoX/Sxy family protein [Gammaproteobacteria bacterium]MBU4325724.1 TfoX/Sxy family protein [Gammaproteobacteria bacterium]
MPIRRPPKPSTTPRPAGEPALAVLPGLGPKSQAMLAAAGIPDLATLRRLGAVVAYARVKRNDPRASLNLLWGIEAALTGLPWQTVAREHRTSLLLALDALEDPKSPRQ